MKIPGLEWVVLLFAFFMIGKSAYLYRLQRRRRLKPLGPPVNHARTPCTGSCRIWQLYDVPDLQRHDQCDEQPPQPRRGMSSRVEQSTAAIVIGMAK
jgi:hypothetical protein